MSPENHALDSTMSTVGATTTYTGAGVSVLGGLMWNEVAMIVGMIVGVVGLIVNIYFKRRWVNAQIDAINETRQREREREKREIEKHNIMMRTGGYEIGTDETA